MGLKFKDIKPGCYYKGYHAAIPMGKKCFFYVRGAAQISAGTVDLDLMYAFRKITAKNWSMAKMSGGMDDDSLLKEEVSPAEVSHEGFPLPHHVHQTGGTATTTGVIAPGTVKSTGPTPPAPTTAAPTAMPQDPLYSYFVGDEEHRARMKAKSKAEMNKGKSIVYGNAHSPKCLRCGMPNKQIPSMAMYWCPTCEPA